MRQEHAADEHSADFFSTPPGSADTSQGLMRDASRRLDDARRGSLPALAALTHTLVAPIPFAEALQRLLTLGLQLLPDFTALRLVVADASDASDASAASLRLIVRAERTADGARTAFEADAPAQTSLGYGAALDRQVLVERRASRTSDVLCIPLVGHTNALLGVLVARERNGTIAQADAPMVALVADHVTALLARHAHEQHDLRMHHVLQRLAPLTTVEYVPDAPAGRSGDAASESALHGVERRVLQQAADLLRELAQPVALALCEVTSRGTLRPFTEHAEVVASPEQHVPPIMDAAYAGLPLMVTPGQNAVVWQTLSACIASVESRSSLLDQVNHLVALPISGMDAPRALVVLGLRTDAQEDAAWLPAARAVATVATASLRALRFADVARAEGQARDAFISLAAHELRSPLTSIKGYAQLLIRQARKNPLTEAMHRSVEAIEQQSVRMAEMVGELLDSSRIQRGILDVLPGEVDLVPLAKKVVERRHVFAPQYAIDLRIDAESLVGNWDGQRVEQVLRDLLDNASRYSPESERILMEVSREDGKAVVTVMDEGIGVPEEDRAHIFDYLYRAPTAEQRNLSGLGLGLFVCRFLAERMGGRLDLAQTSTEPPTGSVFRLTLPLS